jgi:Coenzyme PQQ synthesis protein D (PqqD)
MMIDVSKLKKLAISESGLVFDPATGAIYTSNPAGLLILDGLKEGKEEVAIRELLLKNYAIDRQTVERDMYDFISQLNGSGVLGNG